MEIRMDDLFRKCTACGGDGVIAPPKEPGDTSPEVGRKCDRCAGKGTMLTESGTVLKAFFQMVQDGKF
jgi:DnaJ-class molecular chaperone